MFVGLPFTGQTIKATRDSSILLWRSGSIHLASPPLDLPNSNQLNTRAVAFARHTGYWRMLVHQHSAELAHYQPRS